VSIIVKKDHLLDGGSTSRQHVSHAGAGYGGKLLPSRPVAARLLVPSAGSAAVAVAAGGLCRHGEHRQVRVEVASITCGGKPAHSTRARNPGRSIARAWKSWPEHLSADTCIGKANLTRQLGQNKKNENRLHRRVSRRAGDFSSSIEALATPVPAPWRRAQI
jgi:hypothetical protein